jgi:hypothetical protein
LDRDAVGRIGFRVERFDLLGDVEELKDASPA